MVWFNSYFWKRKHNRKFMRRFERLEIDEIFKTIHTLHLSNKTAVKWMRSPGKMFLAQSKNLDCQQLEKIVNSPAILVNIGREFMCNIFITIKTKHESKQRVHTSVKCNSFESKLWKIKLKWKIISGIAIPNWISRTQDPTH